MAKHDVNFRHGGPITGDSGERGNNPPGIDSIKPYDDGERAVAANFDRPPENLRQRTEVLRGEMEEQKYLQDGDMHWILGSGKADGTHDPGPVPPETLWPIIEVWQVAGGDPEQRWYFDLKPNIALMVQPLNTPQTDMQESKFWEFPSPAPVPTSGVTITMIRRAYSGANIREVVWQALPFAQIVGAHGTPQWFDMELSGEDDHILTLTIRDDDTTQIGHASAAFAAHAAWLSFAGFLGSVTGTITNNLRMVDIPLADVDYIFAGTFEREMHYIPAALFTNFFAVPGFVNCLRDGDTLAVMWDVMTDPLTTDGRRQAIASNANTEIDPGQLFLTRHHPEWIPLAIPLCKRIKQELIWLDGTIVTEGQTPLMQLRFGENGYTVKRLYEAFTTIPIAMTSKWFGGAIPPTWTTVMQALDGIVEDLAGSQDPVTIPVDPTKTVSLMGMPQTTTPHLSLGFYDAPALPADSVLTALGAMIALINEKASLNRDEDMTGMAPTNLGWRIVNRLRFGEDSSEIRDAHALAGLRVIYRNMGLGATDPIVDGTITVYEGAQPPTSIVRAITLNATLSGVVAIAPPAGGNVDITVVIWGAGTLAVMTKNNVLPATPLLVDDPTMWDTYDAVGGANRLIYAHTRFHRETRFESRIRYSYYDDEILPSSYAQDVYILEDLQPVSSLRGSRVRHRYSYGGETFLENRVLEGLYINPHSTGFQYNKCSVSPGAAIVGGRDIIFKQPVDVDDVNAQCSPGTLAYIATDVDAWKNACFWLYVWLRKDGTLWFDHLGPSHQQDLTGEVWTADRVYGPRTGSGLLVGGWERSDYCLIGVTWVACGSVDGTQPWLGFVTPMGDNLWRFVISDYPLGPPGTKVDHVHSFAFPAGGTQTFILTMNNFVATNLRSPGLPAAITHRALINVLAGFDSSNPISNGDMSYYSIEFPLLNALYRATANQYYQFCGSTLLIHPAGKIGYAAEATLAVECGLYQELGFENTRPRYGRLRHTFWCTGAPNNIQLASSTIRLLGFFWDRHSQSEAVSFYTSE